MRSEQTRAGARRARQHPCVSLACVGLATSVGCGPGLSPLPTPASALVTVTVGVQSYLDQYPDRDLRATIAWGRPWENPAICYLSDSGEVQNACRDASLFIPGIAEELVPITNAVDGVLSLMLDHPPDASVAVGSDGNRVAYAGVVILDAELAATPVPEPTPPRVKPYAPHSIFAATVAASLVYATVPHQRVVFRHGSFDTNSTFYPIDLNLCGEPPVGFSVLTDELTPEGRLCRITTSDEPVLPTADYTVASLRALWRCTDIGQDPHRVFAPEPEPAPDFVPAAHTCIGRDVLAQVEGSYWDSGKDCPTITTRALVGCSRNLLCAEPEWDIRANPPAWWPCQ